MAPSCSRRTARFSQQHPQHLRALRISLSGQSRSPFTSRVKSGTEDRHFRRGLNGMTRLPVLTPDSINQNILNVQYAVRGEIASLADQLQQRLKEDPSAANELGFSDVVFASIGNPQALGQMPVTFLRQVVALTEYPPLIEQTQLFPIDAIERARELLADIKSVGAYTHSKGVLSIRKHVAGFLQERDGAPANPEHIYLTAGASSGVQTILSLITQDANSAVMIPIPQYPLYTACLSANNARPVPYYLKEEQDWATSLDDMRSSLQEARDKNQYDVRALVVINPSNPTGGVLQVEQMQEILKLAYDERLVVLADEVYQTNVYQPEQHPFTSFKKVLSSMPEHIANSVELISFHSISKGFTGECGRRGGFFELVNIKGDVEAQLYKYVSSQLCPPVSGQIAVDVMIRPPMPGSASHEQHHQELAAIEESLHKRSMQLRQAFLKLEGFSCSQSQGALYLFPQIKLPPKAIQAAEEAGKKPDAFYCLQLLRSTGICVVPGSGFGQKEGTLHFRTTFLAPQIDEYSDRIAVFHKKFMNQYRE